jgi:copper chaperone CopZ
MGSLPRRVRSCFSFELLRLTKEVEVIELIVSDLTCDDDKATIETAVGTIDPSALAEVDVAGKWVRIASREPANQFVSAIGATGFQALIWWDGSPAPIDLPRIANLV